MAFGHNTHSEHAHFIPVYAMGSTFVTAAWPSLEESWGRVRSDGYESLPTMEETSEHPARTYIPMQGYRGLSEDQAALMAPISWLRDQSRQTSSPPPLSPPPSLVGGDPRSTAAWVHTQHMGPASDRFQARAHTDTSISLSSRPAVPSEVSTNVLQFLGPVDPARVPRRTQRRHDINRLGQPIAPREELSSSI